MTALLAPADVSALVQLEVADLGAQIKSKVRRALLRLVMPPLMEFVDAVLAGKVVGVRVRMERTAMTFGSLRSNVLNRRDGQRLDPGFEVMRIIDELVDDVCRFQQLNRAFLAKHGRERGRAIEAMKSLDPCSDDLIFAARQFQSALLLHEQRVGSIESQEAKAYFSSADPLMLRVIELGEGIDSRLAKGDGADGDESLDDELVREAALTLEHRKSIHLH